MPSPQKSHPWSSSRRTMSPERPGIPMHCYCMVAEERTCKLRWNLKWGMLNRTPRKWGPKNGSMIACRLTLSAIPMTVVLFTLSLEKGNPPFSETRCLFVQANCSNSRRKGFNVLILPCTGGWTTQASTHRLPLFSCMPPPCVPPQIYKVAPEQIQTNGHTNQTQRVIE